MTGVLCGVFVSFEEPGFSFFDVGLFVSLPPFFP